MYAIEIEDLTKYYKNFKALDSVSLYIEQGDVFGFLGPNGSGKSTTINCALGLTRPSSGRIQIMGIEVEKKPLEVKKICGYLPENCGLYENLTAMQNMKYFAELYGKVSKDEIHELLSVVGLNNFADKKVSEFSRGMKQRLALAQALLNDPQVVFLDEPTNGLDPQGIADFRRIVRELQKDGKTIFFSSHILAEVKEVCSSIGIIYKGRIVKTGKVSEIKGTTQIILKTNPIADLKLLEKFGRVKFNEDTKSYTLEVSRDCREELSKELSKHGYTILELRVEELNIEDIYFKILNER